MTITNIEGLSDERLAEMLAECSERRGKFWTIEEADKGGMIGGYPRWLDKQGRYWATQSRDMRKFPTREAVEASPEWAKVSTNREYSVVELDDYVPRKYDDDVQRAITELRSLRAAAAIRGDGEATMAREWCDFCAAIGVDVDTHDAVADQVLAMRDASASTKVFESYVDEFGSAVVHDGGPLETYEDDDSAAPAFTDVQIKAAWDRYVETSVHLENSNLDCMRAALLAAAESALNGGRDRSARP